MSAEQIAAYAEGAMIEEERLFVESHLGGCALCSAEVAEVTRDGRSAPETPSLRRDRGTRWPWIRSWKSAAAAAILLVVAGGAYFVTQREPASKETLLIAEVEALKRAHPDVFRDFALVTPEERRALPRNEIERVAGGLAILMPKGRTRPDLREALVSAPRGPSTYAVLVINDAGETVLTAQGDVVPRASDGFTAEFSDGAESIFRAPLSAASKSLPAGHYLIEVTVTSALGRGIDRQSFEVVGDDELVAFESGRRLIAAGVTPLARPLVLAHFAWRRGFLGDAIQDVIEALMRDPGNTVARETLGALRSP